MEAIRIFFSYPITILIIKILVVYLILPLILLVIIYAELKILAHIQHRLGPMVTGGFHGWLQPVADGLKFFLKEDIIPTAADKWIFFLAPLVFLIPAFMVFVALPISGYLVVENMDLGLFYVIAIAAVAVIGLVMAGWGSGNKYSLMGSLRAVAQVISYELPLAISAIGVAMMAGSLNLITIGQKQSVWWLGFIPSWYVIPQFIGFAVFLIAGLAELTRIPFDLPQADSEIVEGPHVEYSGMKFAFFYFAEYLNLVFLAAMITVLYLGAWNGPFFASPIWFLIKMGLIIFFIMWLRGTFPRIRPDQLMEYSWKILLPLSLLNILVTGIFKVYF